jgi:DNA-binding transcriptional LysR family regulator
MGSLRIGFVASAMRHLLPPILARFRVRYPDVLVELTEATTAQQLAGLLSDTMDLGLVIRPIPAQYDGAIATRVLERGRLVAAVPRDHPVAKHPKSRVQLAALRGYPWILFPPHEGQGLHDVIVGCCARAGFTPQVAQRAIQMETIIGLVSAGFGIALVPETLADERRRGVTYLAVTGRGTPVPYEPALAWRKQRLSPVLATFLKLAAEH